MAEGLAALRARPPDILLLDMNLPDGTGMEVLRAVRDDPRLAAIPVVIVSADAMASQVDAALQAGADSYLAKPLRMNEVLLHIDDALELKARRAGAATPLGTSRAPV
jgi:CheY-like chemotaxis protein